MSSACGSPTHPSVITPSTDPPVLSCPTALTAPSTDGSPVRIAYADPVVAGGEKPLSLSCTPASGTPFAVGMTTVMCSVTDAQRRASACSFSVTVTPPSLNPRLSVTKFLAFGDSITAGFVPDGTDTFADSIYARVVQPDASYPSRLETMLRARYTGQTLTVINSGVPGEKAVEGVTRLPGDLARHAPDVLLLQEGVNDIDSFGAAAIPATVEAVRTMIRTARGRGARVIVGTLLPQISGLKRAAAPELMAPFNAQLVPMAISEGASVVDLYSGILLDVKIWISPLDGLHPTPAGYSEMARLFFGTLIVQFEVTGRTLAIH